MEELLEIFKGYKFFEEDHHYEIDGQRVGTSVTTLIHDFSNPFDKEEVSLRISNKTGEKQEDILEKWRIENLFSTIKGTLIHEFAQGLWNGDIVKPKYDEIKEIDIERLQKSIHRSCIQARQYYDDHKGSLTVFKDEFIVGSKEYDIAGSIDNLLLTKDTNDLVMIDYKTNKKINYTSYNGEKMLSPLSNLEDCNYIHYSLQLCIYKILIEKYSNIKIKNVYIVYFDEQKNDYEKIRVKNVLREAQLLLETRICQ